ncbi:hypothetical protein AMS68_004703 [Peltaster fructicola]|uniref:Major facilitator superfamily (MFS) profile domain-containing protein n=1 Tax=Peltaster fructicola TaxID=286661 RepID=A0A6H0XWX6_9PEZI|nr:hypothetical protein AMS68_004703 [Peltaster fructicola]
MATTTPTGNNPLAMFPPPRYISASILCAFGGFLLGIDTSIIGPTTIMKSFVSDFGTLSSAVHGLIVSMILLSAAVSSFFAGKLADSLGRVPAIALGAAVLCLGVALEAGAVHIGMFAAGRLIEGFGYGAFFATQTVYICEISPPTVRGPLTSLPQFLICVGLVVGYFTCYGTASLPGSLSWRLPFIVLAVLSALYVVLTLSLLPASPRWLIENGRQNEADKIWDMLEIKHEDRLVVEQEIRLEQVNEIVETTAAHSAPSSATFKDMFTPETRERTMLAVFMMGFLQLCGIDAVLYQYAPLLFQQAGLASEEASFLASGVSGIAIVVSSVPALLLADRWGRRTSVLIGGISLSVTMALMAALYAANTVHAGEGTARFIVIACIYVYCITVAATWGVTIKVYAPEIQPQQTRAQATSLAYGVNWLANWFVVFVSPIMLERSSSAAYFLFAACTAIATVVCFVFMVETRGAALDEVEERFKLASECRRLLVSKMLSSALRRRQTG